MIALLLALIVCCFSSQAVMTSAKERYVGGGICKNVCVVGATHGNELHGVYFVDEFNHPDVSNEMKEKYPSIDLKSIIANPYAVMAAGTGAGLRYCEVDLNRCFLVKDLLDPSITTIEGLRAKEIDRELGPKISPNPRTDFIFDIHSSTSNTGILLCCHPDDTFAWQLVAYLQHKYPKEITACLWSEGEVPLLPSVSRSGMTVEVGPIAHSTANSALYHRTKDILKAGIATTYSHPTTTTTYSHPTTTITYSHHTITTYSHSTTTTYPHPTTTTYSHSTTTYSHFIAITYPHHTTTTIPTPLPPSPILTPLPPPLILFSLPSQVLHTLRCTTYGYKWTQHRPHPHHQQQQLPPPKHVHPFPCVKSPSMYDFLNEQQL